LCFALDVENQRSAFWAFTVAQFPHFAASKNHKIELHPENAALFYHPRDLYIIEF